MWHRTKEKHEYFHPELSGRMEPITQLLQELLELKTDEKAPKVAVKVKAQYFRD